MIKTSLSFAMPLILIGLAACGGETASGSTTSSSAGAGGGASSTTSGSSGSGGSSATSSSTTTSSSSSATSSTSATSSSSGGPPPGSKRVFVTSATYTGNLKLHGGAADGLQGGDKLCQLAADAAQLGGTWRAWLSSSTMNAIDRIPDVGPWYRLNGPMVFPNKASIVTAGPTVPIDVNELGGTPMTNTWTGTRNSGVADLFTCKDWTDEAPINGYEGTVGITVGLQFWTEGPSNPCKLKNTLYCFEQ